MLEEQDSLTRYKEKTVKECFELMLSTEEYWDIYQQASHPRWNEFKKDCTDWKEVARSCMTQYAFSREEDYLWISRLFELASMKVEAMSSGPFSKQAG